MNLSISSISVPICDHDDDHHHAQCITSFINIMYRYIYHSSFITGNIIWPMHTKIQSCLMRCWGSLVNETLLFYSTIGRRRRRRHFLCFCWRCDGIVFCSKSMCVWCVWWWMECMHEYVEATHQVHHILHHHTNDKASRQDYTLLFLTGSLSLSLPFFSLFIALDSIFTSCNSKNEFLISSYIVRIIFFCGWE